eukprot:TRINITY_DN2158_c0_g1_i1.p1 TRINITY_DN2158_c0_g1~~TRINITY_DN2158_c0_g1_i1.p1  ORF type:complete len:185 (+),score=36.12 TRINITY_DN2158_c0_g1_i1:112-666(+)
MAEKMSEYFKQEEDEMRRKAIKIEFLSVGSFIFKLPGFVLMYAFLPTCTTWMWPPIVIGVITLILISELVVDALALVGALKRSIRALEGSVVTQFTHPCVAWVCWLGAIIIYTFATFSITPGDKRRGFDEQSQEQRNTFIIVSLVAYFLAVLVIKIIQLKLALSLRQDLQKKKIKLEEEQSAGP